MHLLAQEIREAMQTMKEADTETEAAKAFQSLETAIGEYVPRSADMQQQFYRQRAALARQAAQIEDLQFERVIGTRQDHHLPVPAAPSTQPEILISPTPQVFFVRLSFGFVALQHIITLNVKSKTLYTAQGTQSLTADDVRTLIPQMKMHMLQPVQSISKIYQERIEKEQTKTGTQK